LTSSPAPQLYKDGAPRASQIVSALAINSGCRMAPSKDVLPATTLVHQTMIAAALDFVLMAFAASTEILPVVLQIPLLPARQLQTRP